MNQLFVPVRRWRRRGHKAEAHSLKQRQERLIGLRSKAAQHARFIQAYGREQVWVQLAVPHRLVVGQVHTVKVGIDLGAGADEPRRDSKHFRVAPEFLADTQRADDQCRATAVRAAQPKYLKLLHRFTKSERLEQCPPAAFACPLDAEPLMRFQQCVNVPLGNIEAERIGDAHLRGEELVVGGHAASSMRVRTNAVPMRTGTAFPICFVISVAVPAKSYSSPSSSNDVARDSSRQWSMR